MEPGSSPQLIINESKVMKNILAIACLLSLLFSFGALGQTISETTLSMGISKPSSPNHQPYWEEDSPVYLLLGGTKSWYPSDQPISLRKEVGLNLQYANIDLETGGLGANNHYTGSILSLSASASLQARFVIYPSVAVGIGPEAELLLMGKNHLDDAHFTMLNGPTPTSGVGQNNAMNRDYFNKPSLGIKLSLFESAISEKTTLGIHISHLWTKSEFSNFYASRYMRISLFIGFRKPIDELPTDTDY